MCRNRHELKNLTQTKYAVYTDDFNKEHWQHKVHNDSSTFLQMCKELQVIPDLWALYEWTAWASPPSVRKG